VDLAPLPKVLREHLREQELLQQQQLEKLAAMDTDNEEATAAAAMAADGTAAAAANGVAGAAGGADQGGGTAAAAPAGAAAAKPVPVPDLLSDAEQEHWVKTDNIIMNVLRRCVVHSCGGQSPFQLFGKMYGSACVMLML
jgi:hypothetical protein